MKNLITVISIFILTTMSCKAQHIIPVEDGYKYIGTEQGFMGHNNYVYVKDVNNVLSKFLGTWKGTYNSKHYEFKISKRTIDDGELKEDQLLLRYKITNNNGTVIENTLDLTDDSPFVMQSGYMGRDGGYVFSYIGKNMACGQNGWVFTQVYGIGNTKLQLFLQVEGENYPECTTGIAEQVLPLKSMELLKQ